MTLHPLRKPRHAQRLLTAALAPLALALAASLATAPAHAATRYWTFIGGCGSADWLSTTAGPNAQNNFTCWSDTFPGLSGQAPPAAGDDTFIINPTATATLLVNLSIPTRPAFTATARDLTLYGSTSFATGLTMDASRWRCAAWRWARWAPASWAACTSRPGW